MNLLRRNSAEEDSEAVVVSFAMKWLNSLKANDISVVFRKRGPTQILPKWIYAYVASPLSAMVGRTPVESCRRLPVKECLKLADAGKIAVSDLEEYADGYLELVVYRIGEFVEAEMSYLDLSKTFGFKPPQSFFYLSLKGKLELDSRIGFSRNETKNG